jgi:hypothetical protein
MDGAWGEMIRPNSRKIVLGKFQRKGSLGVIGVDGRLVQYCNES